MSIAEKLVTIAENEPKVYEAGQKSMVDESKIIPKTVTGNYAVHLDDVSEIPHNVNVKVEKKNILDVANAPMFGNTHRDSRSVFDYERTETGLKFNIIKDTSAGAARSGYTICPIDKVRGKSLTLSFNHSGVKPTKEIFCIVQAGDDELIDDYTYKGGSITNAIQYVSVRYDALVNDYGKCTFTVPTDETRKYLYVVFYVAYGTDCVAGDIIEYSNIQVNIGDEATSYSPYIEDLSQVPIKVLGKNILDVANAPMFGTHHVNNTKTYSWERTETGQKYTVLQDYNSGSGRISYVVCTIDMVRGKSITLSFNRAGKIPSEDFVCVICAGDTEFTSDYTNFNEGTANTANYTTVKYTNLVDGYCERTITIPANETRKYLYAIFYPCYGTDMVAGDIIEYSNIQVEIGGASEYEPYKDNTYTLDENGEVTVKSISPTMRVFADVHDISVSYNRSYGMQTEWDRFWDGFQENGNRKYHMRGFQGYGFDASNFYPKYDIKPTGDAQYMFVAWEYDRHNINLKERLEECGVALDLSGCTNVTHMFYYGNFSEIPTCDFTGVTASSINNIFAYCRKLVSIEKVVINDTVSCTSWFNQCNALENIRFEGAIGKGINFQWSTNLTHDSLMSIINALKDYSGDTSGTTYTVTLGSTNIAKLTEEELDIIDNKGWKVV